MWRDPPTSSCQVKPQRPAPGTAGSGYIGPGVNWAQTQSWDVLFMIEYHYGFYAHFNSFWDENPNKGSSQICYFDIVCFSGNVQNYCRREKKTIRVVVLNVCPLCNWESNPWKMNQVIALRFSMPYTDHLSQLSECSNLNVKCYTDQSTIPQFIPCMYSINIEKRAEQEIKNIFQWHGLNNEPEASAGIQTQNINLEQQLNLIESHFQEKQRPKHTCSLSCQSYINYIKLNKYHIPNILYQVDN